MEEDFEIEEIADDPTEPCPECHGTGHDTMEGRPCGYCDGMGYIEI